MAGMGIIGAASGVGIVSQSPIANEGMRVADPWGEWRRVDGNSFFHAGAYLRDSGVGYLVRAAASGDPQDGTKAQRLFTASLDRAPGDAVTWTLLAWSEAFLGNRDAGFAAQERSWQLAPHNVLLAAERLAFVAAHAETLPSEQLREPVRRDIEVLYRQGDRARILRSLSDQIPAIAIEVDRLARGMNPAEAPREIAAEP